VAEWFKAFGLKLNM